MSRYLYKKIQNISPESLNFQHSGLKLTTLGSDPTKYRYKEMERTDAIAHITSKLGDQINKKLKANMGKKSRNQFNTPFDQLCLDSIPEMIYNAILFYIDYKGL